MQYTASTINRTALPRSKRMRALGAASVTPTVVNGESDKYWNGEIDTETEETEVSTTYPVKISKRLRIVDESGALHGDITIDANGRFVFDKGIISKEDIIAYGVGGEDVKSVTDVIEEYLAEHGVGGYEPPVGGIPKSDLSSSVQASLGKADTALQEHQSLQGYATEQWVEDKGYLTAHQDISGKSNTTHTHSVKINGVTKTIAASGGAAVDLGTYLTAHQDISGKADKSSTVSTIAYDSTNKKITKTINGTTSDVVTVATLKSAMSLAKGDVGLGNVNNTADANKDVLSAKYLYTHNINSKANTQYVVVGQYTFQGESAYKGVAIFCHFRNGGSDQTGFLYIRRGEYQDTSTLNVEFFCLSGRNRLATDLFRYKIVDNILTLVMVCGHNAHANFVEILKDGSDRFVFDCTTELATIDDYASAAFYNIARTSDNVASATKLQTARTLWGNSFDGSANINGNIIHGANTFAVARAIEGTTSVWTDVNNDTHAWYGMQYNHNHGVYSTTISDYFGMTLKTGGVNLSLTELGNVGIGTTSPTYKLDVDGVSRSQYMYFRNIANTGNAGFVGRGSAGNNVVQMMTLGADALVFGTNSTEKMRITSDGKVGIGTTSPSEKLEVDTATSGGFVQIKKNSNAGVDCGFKVSNSTYALELMIGSGNVNRGLYDRTNNGWWIYRDSTTNTLIPTGNVGIGTTNPLSYKLYVLGSSFLKDSSSDVLRIKTSNPDNGAYVLFFNKNQDTNYHCIGSSSDNKFHLTTGSGSSRWTVFKSSYDATGKKSYIDIGVDDVNHESANLNLSVNGFAASGRIQLNEDGNLYLGRGHETTTGNDNAGVRIHGNGGLILSSTKSVNGETRNKSVYIRPEGSSSNTNQTQFGVSGVNISGDGNPVLSLKRTTSNGGAFMRFCPINQTTDYWRVGALATKNFSFSYKDGADSLVIGTSGNVTMAKNLSVLGNITASGEVTAYSDRRLKSDIKDLEYRGPLEPKTYVKDGKKSIGFIAQEVREKYPELVLGEEKEDEYLSLNYGGITAVLAAENKELRNEVETLKSELSEIKKNVKSKK